MGYDKNIETHLEVGVVVGVKMSLKTTTSILSLESYLAPEFEPDPK